MLMLLSLLGVVASTDLLPAAFEARLAEQAALYEKKFADALAEQAAVFKASLAVIPRRCFTAQIVKHETLCFTASGAE